MEKFRKLIFLQAKGIVFGAATLSGSWWLIDEGFIPGGIFISLVSMYLTLFAYLFGARGSSDVLNPNKYKNFAVGDDKYWDDEELKPFEPGIIDDDVAYRDYDYEQYDV